MDINLLLLLFAVALLLIVLGFVFFRRPLVARMRMSNQEWSHGLLKASYAMGQKFQHVGRTFFWVLPEAEVKYQRASHGPGHLVVSWKVEGGGSEMMTLYEDPKEGESLYFPRIYNARPIPSLAMRDLEDIRRKAEWQTFGYVH